MSKIDQNWRFNWRKLLIGGSIVLGVGMMLSIGFWAILHWLTFIPSHDEGFRYNYGRITAMSCFSIPFIENLLVWLIIIIGIVAIVQLVIPKLMSLVGASPDGGIIFAILRIVVWVVLAIAIVYFVFDLLSCLSGGAPSLRGIR